MLGVEGYAVPEEWRVAQICEAFGVDVARALFLLRHPTWSRLSRRVMSMRAYRDTLNRYQSKRQNEKASLPADLPYLKDVHQNHFDLTRELADQRRARGPDAG